MNQALIADQQEIAFYGPAMWVLYSIPVFKLASLVSIKYKLYSFPCYEWAALPGVQLPLVILIVWQLWMLRIKLKVVNGS